MPRRIPIRTKLAAALAVPICALLLVSVLEVRQSVDADRETRSQTELATASIGPGGVITTLQNERNYGSVWLLGFEATLQLPVTSFDEAAAATDDAIETFRADLDDKPETCTTTYAPALDHIESELGGLRETVLTYTGPRDLSTQPISDPFFSSYTTLIDELFQANGQAALAIDDPTLRRGVELTDLASHQIENVARLTRGPAPGRRLAAGSTSRPTWPRRPACSGRSRRASTRSASSAPGATSPPPRRSTRSSRRRASPTSRARPSRPVRCRSPRRWRRCHARTTRATTASAPA